MNDSSRARIEAEFDVVYAPDSIKRAAAVAAHGVDIRAVLTNGTTGLSAIEIDLLAGREIR